LHWHHLKFPETFRGKPSLKGEGKIKKGNKKLKLKEENIKLIFGLKLKQLRHDKKLSLAELAQESGLSISYLNEIEKGKKYPKADKIASLSLALNIPYDNLVSLKLNKKLAPIADLLKTSFLGEIPLELFGIESSKLIELFSNAPLKVNAFIGALIEIARTYEMSKEQFYFAILRSYQELNDNYFEELEEKSDEFINKHHLDDKTFITSKDLSAILTQQYNYSIRDGELEKHPELSDFRSVMIPGKPNVLLINKHLSESQKVFILARELGYQYLNFSERVYTFTWLKVTSFEQTLNNYKASYFAGALLINRNKIVPELEKLFSKNKWDGDAFRKMMMQYNSSPETFMHRLTNLLPSYFNINNLFFLRLVNHNPHRYHIDKELHLGKKHNPHANLLSEHHCRRWISVRLMEMLQKKQETGKTPDSVVGVQLSQYSDSENEYFCIAFAGPVNEDKHACVTIGFLLNNEFRKKVHFWNDPQISTKQVGVTCERCSLSNCKERVAPAYVIEEDRKKLRIEAALKGLFQNSNLLRGSEI
jgi:transcriptional regulator with XRE-family HTH domain